MNVSLRDKKGSINLGNILIAAFEQLDGEYGDIDYTMNSIRIGLLKSHRIFKYTPIGESHSIIVSAETGPMSITNVSAYLDDILQRLNGRNIVMTMDNDGSMLISDANDEVRELYYTDVNGCTLTEEFAKQVCKVGKGKETCIFCSFGGFYEKGFNCRKFDSTVGGMSLKRLAENDSVAKRIGGCRIIGRRDGLINGLTNTEVDKGTELNKEDEKAIK